MTELHELTALGLAGAVRRGEAGPVEVTRHFLDRIAAHDRELGAFVTVTAERALDAARGWEGRVARARRSGDLDALPPLAGVPTAVKDLDDVAGVPTSYGSAVYRGHVPAGPGDVARLLEAAGTICLGKTNTPEFGLPCYTDNEVAPPAVTPWDTGRYAGGSSGGAAAAVAAGLLPFAHGSDGGGSIRIPAASTGLVGIKPQRGRVSRGPLVGETNLLAVHGVLARTVSDAAALLDALARFVPTEPLFAPPLPPGDSFAAHVRPGRRLRVGRTLGAALAPTAPGPRQLAAWEDAAGLLSSLGHEVVDLDVPLPGEILGLFETVWSVGALSVPVPPGAEPRLLPLTRYLRERGRGVSALDYVTALSGLQRVARRVTARFATVDAVLTPALAQDPAPVGWFTAAGDPAEDFRLQTAFTPWTSVANVTGVPAVTLPLHLPGPDAGPGIAAMPVSVQLLAAPTAERPAAETVLLELAAELEAAHPWADLHPPQW